MCEDRAFELDPVQHPGLRAAARADVRRRAPARGVAGSARGGLPTEEALPLLRERAQRLLEAGEALLAAEAFDVYLAKAGEDVDALAARAELAAQGGGPTAAQPYDRRLLAVGASLPVPVRVRTWLRLGHASLASGAYRDAADAFEAVVSLDPEGPRGKEALSLLSEAYSRTGKPRGSIARRFSSPGTRRRRRRRCSIAAPPTSSMIRSRPSTRCCR